MPWVDLSDIYDILGFFRSDLSGAGTRKASLNALATPGSRGVTNFIDSMIWLLITFGEIAPANPIFHPFSQCLLNLILSLQYAWVMSSAHEAMTYRGGDDDCIDADW
ncbi:hypothetical protein JB92DRAFT_3093650 [Gautieria morchelliformis]|nr:hypothetical protein JB92DRAFT_3093650 [Gautieria morchelliformis]